MTSKHLLSSDAFWPINKKLLRMIGDPCATILLTDLIDKEDYHKRMGELIEIDGDMYFYATSDKIEERTMLSYKRQKTLLKLLKTKDLIDDVLHGLPAKLHFNIKHENIIKMLIEDEGKVVFPKGESKINPKGNHSIAQREILEQTKGHDITRKELLRTNNQEKKINNEHSLFPVDEILDKREQRKKEMFDGAVKIIDLFNDLLGRRVDNSIGGKNVEYVLGLRKKVGNYEDIELMVKYKVWEWKDDKKMCIHLKPITIFKRHGERYTEEALEIKGNEELLNKVKESKGKTAKNGFSGDISRGVAERLNNY